MIRPIKILLFTVFAILLAWASFAGGQQMRKMVVQRTLHMLPSTFPNSTSLFAMDSPDANATSPSETFQEVLQYVNDDYVDPIRDETKLGFGAVKNMLLSLDDPKTRFLDPDQYKSLQEQMNGVYNGIGAVLTVVKRKAGGIDERRLAIVAPMPGGPAEKAGLQPGDIITYINNRWVIAYDPRLDLMKLSNLSLESKTYRNAWNEATKRLTDGMSLPKALDTLTMKDGTPVTLTIERSGVAKPFKVTIDPTTTQVKQVEFVPLTDNVAYLRITAFDDAATSQFVADLEKMTQKQLILDLRDNTGGVITGNTDGALASFRQLLSELGVEGQVGTVIRKGNVRDPLDIPPGNGKKLKLVVLINRGTSNLAELAADALKEKDGAKLLGSATCGDSCYQILKPLRDGAAMTLTAGKLLAIDDYDFTDKGIKPDIPLEMAGIVNSRDEAVRRALTTLEKA